MRRWLSVVALGVLLGVATAGTDTMAGGLQQDGLSRALSMILNAGSVWAGLAVLCGWIMGRPWAVGASGVVGLVSAVGGYYAFGVVLGDRANVGLAGLTGVIRLWAALAILVGPALGVAGALIHRSGTVGVVAALVVPVVVMVEMVGLRRLGPETFRRRSRAGLGPDLPCGGRDPGRGRGPHRPTPAAGRPGSRHHHQLKHGVGAR